MNERPPVIEDPCLLAQALLGLGPASPIGITMQASLRRQSYTCKCLAQCFEHN